MCCEHTATQETGLAYKTLPQNSLMTAPFKGSMQNEPKPELGISHCNRKWKHPRKVICVRHCAVQQRRQQT